MRHITFTLLISLFLATALTAQAQEDKKPEQKPATETTTTDTKKPKNSVEKMIAAAREHGEEVVLGCAHGCEENGEYDGPGILNGKAVSLPKPEYPAIARAAHAQGAVEVQVLIDFDGKVVAAAVISGHPLLQSASLQAARNSLFKPTKLGGQPVKVTGIIRYTFVAQ